MSEREQGPSVLRLSESVTLEVEAVHFSKINVTRDVWSIDVPLEKITAHEAIDLLLYDQGEDELYHLRIPADDLHERQDSPTVPASGDRVPLELAVDQIRLFQSVKPVDSGVASGRFLVGTCW